MLPKLASCAPQVVAIFGKVSYNLEKDEGEKAMSMFQLLSLQVPLDKLNQRTLVSMLIEIAKDINLKWGGEAPKWWPKGIPFVHLPDPPS